MRISKALAKDIASKYITDITKDKLEKLRQDLKDKATEIV